MLFPFIAKHVALPLAPCAQHSDLNARMSHLRFVVRGLQVRFWQAEPSKCLLPASRLLRLQLMEQNE